MFLKIITDQLFTNIVHALNRYKCTVLNMENLDIFTINIQ